MRNPQVWENHLSRGTLLREMCLEVHSFPDDPDRQRIRVTRYVRLAPQKMHSEHSSLSGNT